MSPPQCQVSSDCSPVSKSKPSLRNDWQLSGKNDLLLSFHYFRLLNIIVGHKLQPESCAVILLIHSRFYLLADDSDGRRVNAIGSSSVGTFRSRRETKISASLNLVNLRQLPFSPTKRRKDRTGYCFQREARPTFNVDCNYQEQAKTMSLPPSFVVATAQQTTTSQRINGAHWKCAESLRS